MYDFKMPSMGADMTSATLVAWNVGLGDRVGKGDILCEIETEKGNIDVEVWEPGVVAELLVKPGQKVPVGEAIARLDEEGAPASGGNGAEAPVRRPSSKPPRTEVAKSPSAEPLPADLADSSSRESRPSVEIIPPPPRTPTATGAASPAARRRAAELGVDLSTVKGSGPGGVIKLADLEGSAEDDEEAPAPASAREEAPAPASTSEADPHQALRNAIARAMARSKREIPHYYLQTTVDVTRAQQWLEQENEERGIKERLLFGGLLTRAVALAARDVPVMNGFFEDGRFTPSEAVHVGFAVAMRGGGVVAPAIHDVDSRSLDETMAAGKDIVRRVRRGKLRSSEMSDPTITLTSLGDMGVDTVFGVIYPPQVAIVGAGSPRKAPLFHDGMIATRTVVDLTLSGDHRVSDGMAGSEFLRAIAQYLAHPEQLR